MQCPSCQFENMPGSGRCARCGGFLALATAAIDVHPPRAARLSRRMPRAVGPLLVRCSRTLGQHSNLADAANPSNSFLGSRAPIFASAPSCEASCPAGPSVTGETIRAPYVFFVSYLALLLRRVCFSWAPGSGAFCWGWRLAMHVARDERRARRPYSRGWAIASIFTFACASRSSPSSLYFPIGRLVVARCHSDPDSLGPIEPYLAGDVLWYKPAVTILRRAILSSIPCRKQRLPGITTTRDMCFAIEASIAWRRRRANACS